MDEKKNSKNKQNSTTTIKAFSVVHSENGLRLCQNNLVPISENNCEGKDEKKEKPFRLVPREFATSLLKLESNSMIPETYFNEAEKKVLEDFARKDIVKSTTVAGETVYFDLNSKIRRHIINVLQHRN